MALLTLPKSPARRGKHAAKTPFWRQVGIGRARHDLTAARLVSPPPPEPAVAKAAPPMASVEQARAVVERLFPAGTGGLYPLDWHTEPGRATAQVDPGLVPDAARNVVLAYAAAMDAPFVQDETGEGRLHMRVSRAVDGVQVTVWADITPQPQLALPAAAEQSEPSPELPIEREVRCVLDDTAVFAPITDDMPDPREHPDADPDGDRPAPPPTEPDHPSNPDAAHSELADEAIEDDTPEDTANTDDTASTPLPQGDEDNEEEEVAVHG